MITKNSNMMLEMMIAEIAGKIYNGDCDCYAVQLEVTWLVYKLLIKYDWMCIEVLSRVSIGGVMGWFDLFKDASLRLYDSPAITQRSFRGDCRASLFYQLQTASVVSIVPNILPVLNNTKLLDKFMRKADCRWSYGMWKHYRILTTFEVHHNHMT